jgi:histone acetyltransferase (RNA polymerase elongator complex component)
MKTRHYTIPIFIPEKACPFQCIFCDQRKISGQHQDPDFDEIRAQIDRCLVSIPKENSEIQIAFFGGTFTGIPLDEQLEYLQVVQDYIHTNQVLGIRISTRPDYIDETNLQLLKSYGVTHIELGAQSLSDEVLKQSQRGHSYRDVALASQMILKYGFVLGLQMMLGLPGDTAATALETAKKIVQLGATESRIYPTLVIRGTALAHLHQQGKYIALSTEEAVKQSAEIFHYFLLHGVKVLRIGLFPSEDLLGQEVLAGPQLTHFKELVMSYFWKQMLEYILTNCSGNQEFTIEVSPKQLNFAIGFRASNRLFLQQRFKRVTIRPNAQINDLEYEVNHC